MYIHRCLLDLHSEQPETPGKKQLGSPTTHSSLRTLPPTALFRFHPSHSHSTSTQHCTPPLHTSFLDNHINRSTDRQHSTQLHCNNSSPSISDIPPTQVTITNSHFSSTLSKTLASVPHPTTSSISYSVPSRRSTEQALYQSHTVRWTSRFQAKLGPGIHCICLNHSAE